MEAVARAVARLSDPALCAHCEDVCGSDAVVSADGTFCCRGCASVFSILKAHALDGFYACAAAPGTSQRAAADRDPSRFAVLDDPESASRFIHFNDGQMARAALSIPAIHCASCVWLLEQLWRFDPGVARTEVDLLRRALRVDFHPGTTSLRRIAERLASLGYEPVVTSEHAAGAGAGSVPDRRLYLQLGVAGFAFGNIMLFSIPRYANGMPLDGGFQRLFDLLNLALALPVLVFSAAGYFQRARQALRSRTMALDVPIAMGLAVLFGRSVFEIATASGEGFLDSFSGLVFFLLIGRLFQQKAFDRVAFDRTFRSFLPLSVQVEGTSGLSAVPIDRVRPGDCMVVRRHEVVPTDAALLDGGGSVDYAFITGEQAPIHIRQGEVVRAGGRVAGRAMRLRALREVSHTQLAGFWNNRVFNEPKTHWLTGIGARFGGWFTGGAIAFAAAGAIAWWPDASASVSVATAVLIVACPCALTLAAPITLGTAMGILGTRGLYLRNPAVALDLSRIDAVVFDKTGTLTTPGASPAVEVHGLGARAVALVQRLAGESVHPASRAIAAALAVPETAAAAALPQPRFVRDVVGHGVCGTVDGRRVAIGTASFVAAETGARLNGPDDAICAAAGDEHGWLRVTAAARPGIAQAAEALAEGRELYLLSGDNPSDRTRWETTFGGRMHFGQAPQDKLAFIAGLQARGRRVLMVGDGLNDAGALAAADVGIAVSDDTACLAPACDAVIDGGRLADLAAFLRYAGRARHVVIACFIVSLLYNAVGLGLALSGALTPLASAILMPVSSLTIVALSSGAMRWSARGLRTA
jgi:Cu+-exporting ATPase